MTSFDLRRIVAEELARAELSLDAFDVRQDRTAFTPPRWPGIRPALTLDANPLIAKAVIPPTDMRAHPGGSATMTQVSSAINHLG